MRSAILSLIVGLGVLGFSLATPTQAKADEYRGPAYTSNADTQLVHWRGGWGWGGYRSYYPGWGGYYRGYYPYGGWYGGYRSYYYPRYYGGYYPWGYGYGVPYSSYYYYYSPGYYW
jgi:hypothetical protein